MPKYRVNFIDKNYKVKKSMVVNAFNKKQAFAKAEEDYKVKEYSFKYIDLYADFLG